LGAGLFAISGAVVQAQEQAPAQEQAQELTVWDKSKAYSAEAWEATKEVSTNAWKASKETSVQVWDATKRMSKDAWDNARGMTGSEEQPDENKAVQGSPISEI